MWHCNKRNLLSYFSELKQLRKSNCSAFCTLLTSAAEAVPNSACWLLGTAVLMTSFHRLLIIQSIQLYTFLALIPAETTCFSCLDLKDSFFFIQLAPVKQPIFAFQWEDLQFWGQQQLTWTHLPQDFKSPQLSLKLPWHLICEHNWQRKLAAPPWNKYMTSFWKQLITETVLKGQNFCSISYGRLDTKYAQKRHNFSRTKLNT
jgi:hypothetical protein